MNDYTDYVIAAYAVFFAVLGWEYVATRLQIRRELHNVRRGVARAAARAASSDTPSSELSR